MFVFRCFLLSFIKKKLILLIPFFILFILIVVVVVTVVGLTVVIVVGISVVVGVSIVVVVVFFRLRTSKTKLISKRFGGFVVLRDFLFSDDNLFQLVKNILLFNKSKYSIREMISGPDQDGDQDARKSYWRSV